MHADEPATEMRTRTARGGWSDDVEARADGDHASLPPAERALVCDDGSPGSCTAGTRLVVEKKASVLPVSVTKYYACEGTHFEWDGRRMLLVLSGVTHTPALVWESDTLFFHV